LTNTYAGNGKPEGKTEFGTSSSRSQYKLEIDCGVTRLGEDWLATSWPSAWVKVLRVCSPTTNEADLLEDAVTLVLTVKSSWSTVEMIVQVSDDIIKVVPKK